MKDFETQIQEISKIIDSNVEELGFEIKENIIRNNDSSSYALRDSLVFSKLFQEINNLDLREDIFLDYLKNSLALNINWAIQTKNSSQYISFNISNHFIFEITNYSEEFI